MYVPFSRDHENAASIDRDRSTLSTAAVIAFAPVNSAFSRYVVRNSRKTPARSIKLWRFISHTRAASIPCRATGIACSKTLLLSRHHHYTVNEESQSVRASEVPRVPVSDPGTTIRDTCVSIRQRHSFHSKMMDHAFFFHFSVLR